MAVQQNKKSPSKRGMHRSHDFLLTPLATEPTSGEVHLRHHISPSGYYRGKKSLKPRANRTWPDVARSSRSPPAPLGTP